MKKPEDNLRYKFCDSHKGKSVFVGGMYTGDFIGTILSNGLTEVTIRVEKPLNGGHAVPGDTHIFPLGRYLILRDPTDAERQIDISEVAGNIEVA